MIKKFNNQVDLAKYLALFILTKIKRKKKFVLGCPGGRSLKKTYYYLGVLSSKLKISLDHLIIIMMIRPLIYALMMQSFRILMQMVCLLLLVPA